MALNFDKMKAADDDLGRRSSGLDYFTTKQMTSEDAIRVLPPHPSMDGLYYLEEKGYWINKRRYVSPATFDEPCVIQAEIDMALASGDPGIKKLLESDSFNSKPAFLLPILLLSLELDSKNQVKKITVDGGKFKVFQANTTIIQAINKIAMSRQFQNGTDDGIFDQIAGYNIDFSKTGTGKDTRYGAIGWKEATAMDDEFYGEAIPDIVDMTRKKIKSDDILRNAIRNYLFGEALMAEPDDDTPAPSATDNKRSIADDADDLD